MSKISKTIERVRELYVKKDKDLWQSFHDFTIRARDSIMPIITVYEESQKDLEQKEKDASVECKSRDAKEFELGKTIDMLVDKTDKKQREVGRLSSKLDTANKRIAELKALLKRVEPSVATTRELYSDITTALYVPKEQTDGQ